MCAGQRRLTAQNHQKAQNLKCWAQGVYHRCFVWLSIFSAFPWVASPPWMQPSLPPPQNPQHLKAKNEQQTLLSSKAWMFTGNAAKTYLESMYYVSCRISTLVEFCGEGWSYLVHRCVCPDGALEGPVSTLLLRTSSMGKMIFFAFSS